MPETTAGHRRRARVGSDQAEAIDSRRRPRSSSTGHRRAGMITRTIDLAGECTAAPNRRERDRSGSFPSDLVGRDPRSTSCMVRPRLQSLGAPTSLVWDRVFSHLTSQRCSLSVRERTGAVFAGCSSLQSVAVLKAASCRQIQSVAVRCSLESWTFNPKVGGSSPPRPTRSHAGLREVGVSRTALGNRMATPDRGWGDDAVSLGAVAVARDGGLPAPVELG